MHMTTRWKKEGVIFNQEDDFGPVNGNRIIIPIPVIWIIEQLKKLQKWVFGDSK